MTIIPIVRAIAALSGVFVTLLATHGVTVGLAYATGLILRRGKSAQSR